MTGAELLRSLRAEADRIIALGAGPRDRIDTLADPIAAEAEVVRAAAQARAEADKRVRAAEAGRDHARQAAADAEAAARLPQQETARAQNPGGISPASAVRAVTNVMAPASKTAAPATVAIRARRQPDTPASRVIRIAPIPDRRHPHRKPTRPSKLRLRDARRNEPASGPLKAIHLVRRSAMSLTDHYDQVVSGELYPTDIASQITSMVVGPTSLNQIRSGRPLKRTIRFSASVGHG
jgi:vacuolar-type H+-ATPase subunit H